MNIQGRRLRRTIRSATALFALVTVLALAGCSSTAVDPVGVNAVMTDPGAYTGQIAITGVVQQVDKPSATITMIDKTEYETCGLTPCGSAGLLPIYLPAAQYDGSLPALKDQVVVIGEIKTTPQGAYFDVERLERNGSVLVSKK